MRASIIFILLFSKLFLSIEIGHAFQVIVHTASQSRAIVSPFRSRCIVLEKSKEDEGEDKDREFPEEDEDVDKCVNDEFQRPKKEDPTVKRKKRKNSSYNVVDNRDSLPFVVRDVTPDPYQRLVGTRKHKTKIPEKKQQSSKKQTKPIKNGSSIPASVVSQNSDGSTGSVIGEFALDKSTTSGDVICIGDVNYQVQAARCQYKYVGGKRFVMVRKILEVKEVTRAGAELFLQHQFSKEMHKDDIPTLEL
jgi:hypothetical protein